MNLDFPLLPCDFESLFQRKFYLKELEFQDTVNYLHDFILSPECAITRTPPLSRYSIFISDGTISIDPIIQLFFKNFCFNGQVHQYTKTVLSTAL